MANIEFHRLEEWEDTRRSFGSWPKVVCSFETRNLGILQVEGRKAEGGWKFSTLKNEPDLNMLSDKEQAYVHFVCIIVYRMVYDVPAAKDRFE